jgi:hypothetical protein
MNARPSQQQWRLALVLFRTVQRFINVLYLSITSSFRVTPLSLNGSTV